MDPAQLEAMARQADAALASQTTDTQLQAAIAASRPDLHAALASNPATYPDLLAWLDSLQNPEVGAALAARDARAAQGAQPVQPAPSPQQTQPGQYQPSQPQQPVPTADWQTQQPQQPYAPSGPAATGPSAATAWEAGAASQASAASAASAPYAASAPAAWQQDPSASSAPYAASAPAAGAWAGATGAAAGAGAVTGASAPVAASAAGAPPLQPLEPRSTGKGGHHGLIAALLVLVLVLVGGGAWWMAKGRGSGSADAASTAAATGAATAGASSGASAAASPGASASAAASGQVTACDKDPELKPTSVSGDAVSLSITVKVTATCSGGDVLAGSGSSVVVHAPSSTDGSGKNDAVVALGNLDLSKDPVIVSGNGTEMTLKFNQGQYFRMADDLSVSHLDVKPKLDRKSGQKDAKATDAHGTVTVTATDGDAKAAEDAAAAGLTWEAAKDKSTAMNDLNGKWVPQISSKKPGLEADGKTYDNRSTLEDFFNSKSTYGDALLLNSDEWSVFDAGGHWWVTVINDGSSDAIFANSWCDSRDIPTDSCFAKYLDPNGTPKGSTKQRD